MYILPEKWQIQPGRADPVTEQAKRNSLEKIAPFLLTKSTACVSCAEKCNFFSRYRWKFGLNQYTQETKLSPTIIMNCTNKKPFYRGKDDKECVML